MAGEYWAVFVCFVFAGFTKKMCIQNMKVNSEAPGPLSSSVSPCSNGGTRFFFTVRIFRLPLHAGFSTTPLSKLQGNTHSLLYWLSPLVLSKIIVSLVDFLLNQKAGASAMYFSTDAILVK